MVRRHGSLPKSEISRRSGLSAQTVSVIMRALEKDGLLLKGKPKRGKVGQPSVPMSLNPEGVYSIGLKIGRRSADLVLMDFVGGVRNTVHETFPYPTPDRITQFVSNGINTLIETMTEREQERIVGIGVATPFELWNWAEKVGAPVNSMNSWRNFDLKKQLSEVSGYPVHVENDATASCGAELVFGRGAEFTDFVYFFIGSFIGGGVVLKHTVYSGRTGNAGALGSMPIAHKDGKPQQLIEKASIFALENVLNDKGIDPSPLWLTPDDWGDIGEPLDQWISSTAKYLAVAIVSSCAVIDFEAAIIDGGFPVSVRKRIVTEAIREMHKLDLQGIEAPKIIEGLVGSNARAIGGASVPLFAHYMLDQNVLFKELN
jgi:predicted NBD/HSP70 family sugar kinase